MARKKNSEDPGDAQTPETPDIEDAAPEAPAEAPGAVDEPIVEEPVVEEPAAADMPEERTEEAQVIPEPTGKRGGGGWAGTVLGGAVAAGLGFGAAYYGLPQAQRGPDLRPDLTALKAQLGAQDADLAALETQVGAIAPGATSDDLAALDARVMAALAQAEAARGAIATELSALSQRIDGFEERLALIERAPVSGDGASAAAIQSFEREIATLRAQIEGQKSESAAMEARVAQMATEAESRLGAAEEEASRIRAEAEAEARRGLARAALSHLRAALESGAAIDGALSDLASAGVTVPPELGEQAKGIPTSQLLQTRFESAARDALSASLRETAGAGWLDRATAFLRSQSGARSLTPRAGDDPDAILSRAEAALKASDIAGAIDEIKALPEAGQAVMAEWIGLADRRRSALSALSALAQDIE